MLTEPELLDEARETCPLVEPRHLIPALPDEDLGHLLDDVAEGLDLGAFPSDADDGDDRVVEEHGDVDAVLGALVLVLVIDGDGLLGADDESGSVVARADARVVCAGDYRARCVEQVDLVVDDVLEIRDNRLCDLRIEFHGSPEVQTVHIAALEGIVIPSMVQIPHALGQGGA